MYLTLLGPANHSIIFSYILFQQSPYVHISYLNNLYMYIYLIRAISICTHKSYLNNLYIYTPYSAQPCASQHDVHTHLHFPSTVCLYLTHCHNHSLYVYTSLYSASHISASSINESYFNNLSITALHVHNVHMSSSKNLYTYTSLI